MTDPAALHGEGVAATARGDPVTAVRLLRMALRALDWPGPVADPTLTGRVLVSLGHAEAERGRSTTGLRLLAAAREIVTPDNYGLVDQQRGLLLLRAGRHVEALRLLNASIPHLAAGPHRDVEARAHLNRATLHLATGDIDAAKADLRTCTRLARSCGFPALAAKAQHNLGYYEYLCGNIPAALHAYASAAPTLAGDPGLVGVMLVDRARALLAVGLAADAADDLDAAVAMFADRHLVQDQADAELVRALAALAMGDAAGATVWAGRARVRFRRRGNPAGNALATLALLHARFHATRTDARLAADASRVARILDAHGLSADAARASLLAARALVARGAVRDARSILDRRTLDRTRSTEVLVSYRLARAELAVAEGDIARAWRQLDSGLSVAARHGARAGSLDLHAGGDAATVALSAFGDRVAWATGSVRRAFNWSERCRSYQDRLTPVRPDADPALVQALAELRYARQQAWSAAITGNTAGGPSSARLAQLERMVRQSDWVRPDGGPQRAAGITETAAALDEAGTDLIYLVRAGDRLGACALFVSGRHRPRLLDLGPSGSFTETAHRLRGDLDMLAGQLLTPAMDDCVRRACADHMAQLDDAVLGALTDAHQPDRPLLVVPTGALAGVPWGCLPRAVGRPVTVAPSATAWLAARARGAPLDGRVVLVSGPDLDHADGELDRIAGCYADPVVLRRQDATVDNVLAAVDGAAIVHVAAHGEHDTQNGLFSRIHLVDGPLMGYDLQRLRRPPRHVVLAACDVGRSVNRHGDGLIGLSASLLHVGVASVVAGVARMSDAATARAMATYHDHLADRRMPSESLADTLTAHPLTPLVCFGAG